MFFAAGTSAVSGIMGHIGAQQQAAAIRQQAEYNAAVQRNNAIAEQQDMAAQAGLAKFNAAKNQQEQAMELNKFREQARRQQASRAARFGRQGLTGGSFTDILKSDALRIEREENEMLWSAGFGSYNMNKEAQLLRERGSLAYTHGVAAAGATLAVGRENARQARISGFGSLLQGAAGAASFTAQGFAMR